MESLRGIFPQTQPPPKRDFLKENVMKIRNMQRMRKPSKETEYSKYNKPLIPRKFSLSDHNMPGVHRSSHSLALCSSKVPLNSLRKSVSTMSIHQQKDGSTQTVDINDDFFLKDSIIRYPSASTIRTSESMRPPSAHHTQVCSRGHQMEPADVPPRPRFKSHFHDRNDEHCDKVERHISNLSEFLERGSITKKQPSSILKNSSSPFVSKKSKSNTSVQKSNKNYINEYQRKEERDTKSDDHQKQESIVISDEDDDIQKEKQSPSEKELGFDDVRQQQLKAAEEDPNCPEGHVPLPENERLEALKLAKKRKLRKRL